MIVTVQRTFGYDGEESGSPVKINVNNLKSLYRTLRKRFALGKGWGFKLTMSKSVWKALGGFTLRDGDTCLDGGDISAYPIPVTLKG